MKILAQFIFVALVFVPSLLIAQVPVADFSATDTAICDSVSVENFIDHSTNNPTSWKWYFPGATPDTSSLQNPTNIQYTGYGCYTVKLIVKNNSGADSLTDSNYICLDSPPKIKLNGTQGCMGQLCTITASGGNKYHWSTGATTSSITVGAIISYTLDVRVYNGACYKDSTFWFVVDSMPTGVFKGDTSICVGNSTTIYLLPLPGHSNSRYTYLWSTGSTTDSIIVNGITPGLYTYYVNVTNGGCVDSGKVKVDVRDCTGIENYSNPSEFIVYPNPSNGIFNLEIRNYELGMNDAIEIYNVLGEKVYSQFLIPNSQFLINLSSQPNGIYFYRVIAENGSLMGEGKMVIAR